MPRYAGQDQQLIRRPSPYQFGGRKRTQAATDQSLRRKPKTDINVSADRQMLKQAVKGTQGREQRFDSGTYSPGGSSSIYSNPSVNAQPYVPDTATSTNGDSAESELDRLNRERLEAALKAIGADFDLQEGNLNSQLEELKNLFETETLKNDRNEGFAQEAILNNSVERGIFNSGITLKNVARGLTPFQEQRAALMGSLNPVEGAEGTDLRSIMSAIALLTQQETDAKASASLDSEKEKLDIAKLLELLNAGLTP